MAQKKAAPLDSQGAVGRADGPGAKGDFVNLNIHAGPTQCRQAVLRLVVFGYQPAEPGQPGLLLAATAAARAPQQALPVHPRRACQLVRAGFVWLRPGPQQHGILAQGVGGVQ